MVSLNTLNGTGVDSFGAKYPLSSTADPQLAFTSVARPFLRTVLGRLPPEIRVEIWKLACSQDEVSKQQEIPCPAILQVSRLMYQEARLIYYANTPFCLTSASNLSSFLKKIGSEPRRNITTLYLSGLSWQKPLFSKRSIDRWCRGRPLFPEDREFLATATYPARHPDTKRAVKYLERCKNLKTIFLSMGGGEKVYGKLILKCIYGYKSKVEIVDDFHWLVRPYNRGEGKGDDPSWEKAIDGDVNACVIKVDIAPSAWEGIPRWAMKKLPDYDLGL